MWKADGSIREARKNSMAFPPVAPSEPGWLRPRKSTLAGKALTSGRQDAKPAELRSSELEEYIGTVTAAVAGFLSKCRCPSRRRDRRRARVAPPLRPPLLPASKWRERRCLWRNPRRPAQILIFGRRPRHQSFREHPRGARRLFRPALAARWGSPG